MSLPENLEARISKQFKLHGDDGSCGITTPFFYNDGDGIELFVQVTNNRYLIHDAGATLWRASESSFVNILELYGITNNADVLERETRTFEEVAGIICEMIQAILEIQGRMQDSPSGGSD